jgi:hypothetical protein
MMIWAKKKFTAGYIDVLIQDYYYTISMPKYQVIIPLLFFFIALSTGCSSFKIEGMDDSDLQTHYYDNPFKDVVEFSADQIIRMGFAITETGQPDPSTYEIKVEQQEMVAINNNRSSQPAGGVAIGKASVFFRVDMNNHVSVEVQFQKPVAQAQQAQSSINKISSGYFAQQLFKRLDKEFDRVIK